MALTLLLLAEACDDAKPGVDPKPGPSDSQPADAKPADAKAPAEAKAAETPAATADAAPGKKDRGSVTARIDGAEWLGECNARARGDAGDKLKLSCSKQTTTEGAVARESIDLTISDYRGVGDYTLPRMGGNFARVAVDTAAAKATLAPDEAGKEPTEAQKAGVVAKSISDGDVIFLDGAKVSITAVSDAAIEGSFSWAPASGKEGPKIEQATFRAVLKK